MKLSIIIVNFNTKEFLKECLDSILNSLEKSKLKYEIIVVDNDSTDGSRKYLEELRRRWFKDIEQKFKSLEQKKFRGLERKKSKFLNLYNTGAFKVIYNKKNLGFAKATNQGIKVAKGEYILLLNPDTIVLRETLAFMVEFMEKNTKVGIATCRVELPSGELDDACHRGFPTPWNAFCHFFGLARIFPKSKFFNGYHLGYQKIDQVHEIDACVGAFLLVRRKAGEDVGWLDEDYFWYGEDLDFCFRMKKAGWKIMFVPDVKIIHYKGVASGIKRISFSLSQASRETKILATNARFEAMRIFYEKHYKTRYPKLVRWFILAVIKLRRKLALLRFKL